MNAAEFVSFLINLALIFAMKWIIGFENTVLIVLVLILFQRIPIRFGKRGEVDK